MSTVHDMPLVTPEPTPAAVDSEVQPEARSRIYKARVDLARREEVLRILQDARLRDERRATSRDEEQRD